MVYINKSEVLKDKPGLRETNKFPSCTDGKEQSPSGWRRVRLWVALFTATKLEHTTPIITKASPGLAFMMEAIASLRSLAILLMAPENSRTTQFFRTHRKVHGLIEQKLATEQVEHFGTTSAPVQPKRRTQSNLNQETPYRLGT